MAYASFGLLMLLSAIWGASFLFIKIGVSEIGPLTFAMLRVLVGSIILLLIIALRRQRIPRDRAVWARFAIMGAVGITLPFAVISWGTQFIPSGLSAILNAAMPLFTFILAVLLGDERFGPRRIVGLLIGFGGILTLTWPQLASGLEASLLGELAVVLGALSYAVAVVYARRYIVDQPPLVASLGQVSTGFLLLLPLSLLERPWSQTPSMTAIWAVLALGSLGTAVAYVLYHSLIQGIGATGTSLVTYIVPVFGVFWGWLVLGERLSWHAFAALGMIFAGLVLVNNVSPRSLARWLSAARAAPRNRNA